MDKKENGNSAIGENASQVAVGDKRKQQLVISIVIIGVLCLIWVSFLGEPSKSAREVKQANALSTSHDDIVQENAKHLEDLARSKKPAATGLPWLLEDKKSETKSMKARRHAPTRLYANTTAVAQLPSYDKKHTIVSDLNNAYGKFANHQTSDVSVVTSQKIIHPESTVAQGEFIHATLETAINSDLPGMARAVVTEPVYAYQGEHVLIPKGSRIVGQYASLTGNGLATARVYVMWSRIITPGGISMMINSPSADTLGRSGQHADAIDQHFWKTFGDAALLSIIGAGASNHDVARSDQANSANAYQEALGNSFQSSASRVISQNMTSIKPTLHIHQGARITLFVAHDLRFNN